jgi:hypothetical protein
MVTNAGVAERRVPNAWRGGGGIRRSPGSLRVNAIWSAS